MTKEKNCKIDNCKSKSIARDLCTKHYNRWYRHGNALIEKEIRTCSVENCEKKHVANGYCSMHNARLKRHGALTTPERQKSTPKTCKIEGCISKAVAFGLCQMHRRRLALYGSPHKTKTTPKGAAIMFLRDLIDNPPSNSECVMWPFYRDDQGYGSVSFEGCVRCVNPKHLDWKSHKENCADDRVRDRKLLTLDQIKEIENSRIPVSQLVKLYNVSPATIYRIRKKTRSYPSQERV